MVLLTHAHRKYQRMAMAVRISSNTVSAHRVKPKVS
jgi:hypothetical protein